MVWSDGAPLESSVERHLFEPFSPLPLQRPRLYICRELCQRYDASISYQRLARNTPQGDVNGNAFIVTLRSGPSSLQATPCLTRSWCKPSDIIASLIRSGQHSRGR
jgi:two-component system sensor histidine kinase PilS (NtrC family)